MKKLKRRLFHRKQYFQRKFLTSIRYFYTKKESKIIPTTDQNLIKERVQAINDEFLEWFVKNPSCEEVEVLHQDVYSMGKWDRRSNIIIPKETPKQNLEKDMFELEQELDIPSHLRFHNSKQETRKPHNPTCQK
jgi:hypothetical protein